MLFHFFKEPQVRHMEVPRLGVESELQLLAYATAMATQGIEPAASWILVGFLKGVTCSRLETAANIWGGASVYPLAVWLSL